MGFLGCVTRKVKRAAARQKTKARTMAGLRGLVASQGLEPRTKGL